MQRLVGTPRQGRIKMGDLGLGRAFSDQTQEAMSKVGLALTLTLAMSKVGLALTLTLTMSKVGTPLYMSPATLYGPACNPM